MLEFSNMDGLHSFHFTKGAFVSQDLERKAAELQRKEQELQRMQFGG